MSSTCKRRSIAALGVAIVVSLSLGCGDSTAPRGGGGPSFNHVYIVVEENTDYTSVIGSSSMPYLNGLAQQYGLATNYYADTHPSIGNYFMLATGQIITNNDGYSTVVTVDNIVRGAMRSGHLGYWIDRAAAGRGMTSLAVALVCDHAFGPVGLHRLQADIRPENGPSQRLVARLGFTQEGLLRRYLDIDGDWRDHLTFALLAEDAPAGVLNRWRERIPR